MRPPRPIATEHRKGAYAAALAEREHDGELELPADRQRSTRIVAAGPKELLVALAEKAMRVLEEQVDIGDAHEQLVAAQVLIAAWSKVAADVVPPPELSPEERRAKLLENFRDPDPELLAVMREAADDIQKALKGT